MFGCMLIIDQKRQEMLSHEEPSFPAELSFFTLRDLLILVFREAWMVKEPLKIFSL